MESKTLGSYFNESADLSVRVHLGKVDLSHFLERIQHYKDETSSDHDREFLQGEYAFYRGDHKEALKAYLQAKHFPGFEFFCLRASAFASFHHMQADRALSYAEKALAIKPKDHKLLLLYEELLLKREELEKAKEVRETIDEIEACLLSNQEKISIPIETSQKRVHLPKIPLEQTFNPCFVKQDVPMLREAEELQPLVRYSETDKQHTKKEESSMKCVAEQIASPKEVKPRYEEKKAPHLKEGSSGYEEATLKRGALKHERCLFFEGSNPPPENHASALLQSFMALQNKSKKHARGGIFFTWDKTGILINPEGDILELFHKKNLSLYDLDTLIVSDPREEVLQAVSQINTLLRALQEEGEKKHEIRFILHEKAFDRLHKELKPLYKQERGMVQSLEFYLDSPEIEGIRLTNKVHLHYFFLKENRRQDHGCPPLCSLLFDLGKEDGGASLKPFIRFGLIHQAPKTPEHLALYEKLDLCVLSLSSPLESEKPGDFESEASALSSLIAKIDPKVCLLSPRSQVEASSFALLKEGRKHLLEAKSKTAFLPASSHLEIDLESMKVRCGITKTYVDPIHIRVVKISNSHEEYKFLAPSCIL